MIVIHNTQRFIALDIKKIRSHVHAMLTELGYEDFDLGILFTTNKRMQQYNKTYRGKNQPTNILSFPFHAQLKAGERIIPTSVEEAQLGDLIVAPEYISGELEKEGPTFDERLELLLAHGIAHLLGYDHISDEDYTIMHKVEKKLLASLKKSKASSKKPPKKA